MNNNLEISETSTGKRIDVFLVDNDIFPSRTSAQAYIKQNKVKVNGKPVKKNYVLQRNDCIEHEPYTEDEQHVLPEDIPLDIRYENENMLVISKQPGLICHPTSRHTAGTLVNALLYLYGKEKLCNVDENDVRYGVVHRLDSNTSGLMMCAKTDACAHALIDMLRRHNVDRRYICLVHGQIKETSGKIDVPLCRDKNVRNKRMVGYDDDYRDAITTFNVIKRYASNNLDAGYTLVECRLHTGRTHQIRAHMEYIGHPVVGDTMYCKGLNKQQMRALGLKRQFLHSYYLNFTEPISGHNIEMKDRLNDDLLAAISKIEDRCVYDCDEISDFEGVL